VPNTQNPLPISCPKCHHNGSTLVVKSITVMTVKCANCRHTWATDLPSLSPEIQETVRAALQGL
jgi:transcription elongation factor Elf1